MTWQNRTRRKVGLLHPPSLAGIVLLSCDLNTASLPTGRVRVAFVPLHGGLPVPSAAVTDAAEARVIIARPRGVRALTRRLPASSAPPPVVTRSRQAGCSGGRLHTSVPTCRCTHAT